MPWDLASGTAVGPDIVAAHREWLICRDGARRYHVLRPEDYAAGQYDRSVFSADDLGACARAIDETIPAGARVGGLWLGKRPTVEPS